MPDRNIAGLRAVRDLIKKSPEKHNQESWVHIPVEMVDLGGGAKALVSCGTSACVAGWAAAIAGAKYIIDEYTDEEDGVYYPGDVQDLAGNKRPIDHFAAEVLGLTSYEAGGLFAAENTRDEVLTMLKRLIKGKSIA